MRAPVVNTLIFGLRIIIVVRQLLAGFIAVRNALYLFTFFNFEVGLVAEVGVIGLIVEICFVLAYLRSAAHQPKILYLQAALLVN